MQPPAHASASLLADSNDDVPMLCFTPPSTLVSCDSDDSDEDLIPGPMLASTSLCPMPCLV